MATKKQQKAIDSLMKRFTMGEPDPLQKALDKVDEWEFMSAHEKGLVRTALRTLYEETR